MSDLIDPALGLAKYRKKFERDGRVRIPGILVGELAEDIYRAFETAPWRVTYRRGGKVISHSREEFGAFSSRERSNLKNDIHAETINRFQFSYLNMALSNAQDASWDSKQVLPKLLSFIESSAFVDFGRTVTGISEIVAADSQATCYMRESFLTMHTDAPTENRVVAYVLSFAKNWKYDWGGLLHFYDERSLELVDSFVPVFNAITLFRVPQWHSVSYVTPFAMGPRFSVTGWFTE